MAGPEIAIVFVFLFSLSLARNIVHPAALQTLMWTVLLLAFAASKDAFVPVSDSVRYVFVASSAAFACGALLTSRPIVRYTARSRQFIQYEVRDLSIPIIIATLYCIWLINSVSAISASLDYFVTLRAMLTEGEATAFGIPGAICILIGAYIVAIISVGNVRKYPLVVSVMCWLLLSTLLMAKFLFLFVIVGVIFSINYRVGLTWRGLAISAAGLAGLFFLITILRHSDNIGDDGFIFDFLRVYIFSAIPAFALDTELVQPHFIGYTFRSIALWFNRIGGDLPVHPLLQEFIFTPLPTNVYTYLHAYFLEMGWFGVLVIPFCLGSIHGRFHYLATQGSVRFRYLSSLLMYPLVMQFFAEQYLQWLSNWIYVGLISSFAIKVVLGQHGEGTNFQISPVFAKGDIARNSTTHD